MPVIRTVSHLRSWAGTGIGQSVCCALGSQLGSNGSISFQSLNRGYATWKESNATESEEDVRADRETEIPSVEVLEKVTQLKEEVPEGWSEENATESEADVKADRVKVESVEALDAYTIEKLKDAGKV